MVLIVSPKHLKPSRDRSVQVSKIYEGQKSFWRFDAKVSFLMFEHKTEETSCIEVISYFSADDTMEAPRLYLSSKGVLDKLKKSENNSVILAGKAMYIFNRIVMVKKPLVDGVSFNVSILPLSEDPPSSPGNKDVDIRGLDYVGEPILGPLPNIFKHDEDELPTDLMLEWGEKLADFQVESDAYQEHTTKAGKYCKATGDAFAIFLQCFKHKTYPEDAVGVSIPRRRWCKAIRMQLLRGHVKRITEMLDRRESDRLKILIGNQGECVPGIQDLTLDGLSKKLQELSDKSGDTTRRNSEASIESNDLSGECESDNIMSENTGMFTLPMMKIKTRSKINLLNTEDVAPTRRISGISKSCNPSPTLSRQSSISRYTYIYMYT
jgi:hypothetical protein